MADMKQRIEAAIKRRDDFNAQRERAKGRLEEAEKNLQALRDECKSKNLDPDDLDATVLKLEKALSASVAELESKLDIAEKAIKPYTHP